MEKVRFGIVGCGNMGTGHSRHFREGSVTNGVLTAVCDINEKKFTGFNERFGDSIAYFNNAEDMYKSGLSPLQLNKSSKGCHSRHLSSKYTSFFNLHSPKKSSSKRQTLWRSMCIVIYNNPKIGFIPRLYQ